MTTRFKVRLKKELEVEVNEIQKGNTEVIGASDGQQRDGNAGKAVVHDNRDPRRKKVEH